MRIHLERNGAVFAYERPPLPEHLFKALCLLAAGVLYVGLMTAVAALCGAVGVGIIAAATLFAILFANA
ncbi:MAG: hypothetical protein K2P22_11380 [Lachnospiraceae bacterium]|nr:hypothetical protein [Lachnospiraceae bacterium]